jgi:hypothetical protein
MCVHAAPNHYHSSLGAKTARPNRPMPAATPWHRTPNARAAPSSPFATSTSPGAIAALTPARGSIDFTATARSVLLAGCGGDDAAARALVHIKCNLAALGPTLAYAISEEGFRWAGESPLRASDLLAPEATVDEASTFDEARAFLRRLLAAGLLATAEIYGPAPGPSRSVTVAAVPLFLVARWHQDRFGSRRGGNSEIYVMNADGSGQTRLTSNPPGDEVGPAWSPNGAKIAYVSDVGASAGRLDIYVMNADGSGQTLLIGGPNQEDAPNWSPDGARIAFHSDRVALFSADVYVANADGSGVTRLTAAPNSVHPAWSPDGARIAFYSDRDGNSGIWVMNADGSGQTKLTHTANPGGDASPDWQPLPAVAFATFAARAEIDLDERAFELRSTFTLGAGSDGIAPRTEEVTFQLGTYTATIPAGSFVQDKQGRFSFEGSIGGVHPEAQILPLKRGGFELSARGEGVDLAGTVNPVTVAQQLEERRRIGGT